MQDYKKVYKELKGSKAGCWSLQKKYMNGYKDQEQDADHLKKKHMKDYKDPEQDVDPYQKGIWRAIMIKNWMLILA